MTTEIETALPHPVDAIGASHEDFRAEARTWATLALQKHGLEEIVDAREVASSYGEFSDGVLYLLYPEDVDPCPHGLPPAARSEARVEVLAEAILRALGPSQRVNAPADAIDRLIAVLSKGN